MTQQPDPIRSWDRVDGAVLYENRLLDERVCERLAIRGFLDENVEDGRTVYTINSTGIRQANKLRLSQELSGFNDLTDR
jgi:hypothetical protein